MSLVYHTQRSNSFTGIGIVQLFERKIQKKYEADKLVKDILNNQDKNKIITLFDTYIDRLHELLNAKYSLNGSPTTFSYKNCFIILIKFIVESENTVQVKKYRNIIEIMYNNQIFFDNLILSIFQITENCKPKCLPKFKYSDYILQILKLIKIFTTIIKDSINDEKLQNLYLLMRKVIDIRIDQNSKNCDEIKILETEIAKIIYEPIEIKEENQINKKTSKYSILPGNLREKGTRHDNDHINFKEIQIIPTSDELKCFFEPYLPNTFNSSSWYDNPMGSYLDFQFRLLREDSLCSFRKAVQYFLSVGLPDPEKQTFLPCKDKNQKTIGTIQIYHPITINKSKILHKTGELSLEILFNESIIKNNQLQETSTNFWGNKFLQAGSLVCLVIYFNQTLQTNNEKLIPCIVESSIEKSVGKILSVILKPLITEETVKILNKLLRSKPNSKLIYLLEVQGQPFFVTPYKILKTLHKIDITKPYPIFKKLQFDPSFKNHAEIDIPNYLKNKLLDFSCILKENHQNFTNLTVEEFINNDFIHDNFTMDNSQLDAFKNAISQSISLIQGPPGTGKSFVGSQIVNFLIRNESNIFQKSNKTPILCICYTNHALDQFLINLHKIGISKFDIVRIGSRSRSNTIENHCTLISNCNIPEEENLNRFYKQLSIYNDKIQNINEPVSREKVIKFIFKNDRRFALGCRQIFKDVGKLNKTDVQIFNFWYNRRDKQEFTYKNEHFGSL